MNLYNARSKTIKLFEDKSINPSVYAYNAKSEPKKYDGVKKSEQKSVERIEERVKLRRQKADHKSDDKADGDKSGNERLDTADMPDLETE